MFEPLKAAIASLIRAVSTRKFLEWLLLYVAEQLVKSTKTPYDDELLKKIREALGVR